jgi:hypothetical protein
VELLAKPDELRVRVGGLLDVFAFGGRGLGDFQTGLGASAVGAPGAMLAGGLACLAVVATARTWAPQLWSYRGEDLSLHPAPQPARLADDD